LLHENKFLDIKEYGNEELYYEGIDKMASTIQIYFPKLVTADTKVKEKIIYMVKFNYHDARKWKSLLTSVSELTNQAVKENLQKKFKVLLLSEKIRKAYDLEDSAVTVQNLWEDYETISKNKISYLKEQAAIAKKLGISKNTIEIQKIGEQNALISNIKTDSPFYFRGYEAINKEISLILSRTNKEAFVSGLLESEQKIRKVEQEKSIKRLQLLFDATPLADGTPLIDGKPFYAANFATTRFDYIRVTQNSFMFQAILIGLIIGLLYTLISNRLQSQNATKKKKNN